MEKRHILPATGADLLALFLLRLALDHHHQSAQMMMVRVVTVGLWTALGFGLGWFLSPDGRHARKAVALACLALLAFITIAGNSYPAATAAFLLSLIGFCGAFGYWLGTALHGLLDRPTTFGSAEWATYSYLKENGLIGDTGIRLGTFPGPNGPEPIHYTGDRHLWTTAPTRGGKGTTLIVNNLLTYAGSALVLDPKGENALITADARRAMGQDVHIVDPWGIATDQPSRFNPLDWLVKGDPDITENAMLLADALVVPDASGDKFWTEEAKAQLAGTILYVATDEREAGQRHLARVRDLLLLDGDDMKTLFERMIEPGSHHLVAATGARSLQKEPKLLANVIASAQAQTHIFDSARVRESVSASDFRFEDLKANPNGVTIYLVLPADRLETFSRWLRLLIQQALTVTARDIAHQPDKPVLFLLDEMPSLGKLASIETAYSLLAGFGMRLWGVCQDASRMKAIYGDAWESFVSNSGAITYFGSRDKMTAEYFSSLCGVTTVWNLSSAIARVFGSSSGKGGVTSSQSRTNTETTAASQRQLAYADELMRVHPTKAIAFVDHHHPIIINKVRWFDDPALSALGRNLKA